MLPRQFPAMSMSPFQLTPYLALRPWGGTRLESMYGVHSTERERYGEAWVISDRPEGAAKVLDGPYAGQSFRDLVQTRCSEMLGSDVPPSSYPLLVKYIDAAQDLSVQVHPDDAYTRSKGLNDRGKTECWYVVDCQPGTRIISGLLPGVKREDLHQAIIEKRVQDCVRFLPIQPGLFLFVPPGTVHAILGGTLICEIQQSSDLTFRMWDWNRKPERKIHVEESLEVIRFGDSPQPEAIQVPLPPDKGIQRIPLTTNEFFEVEALLLGVGEQLELPSRKMGVILNGVSGTGFLDDRTLTVGSTFFVPAGTGKVCLSTHEAPMIVLMSSSKETGLD